MMPRRRERGVVVSMLLSLAVGCGGPSGGTSPGAGGPSTSKGVAFVGFDASEALVDAMREGKIQGLVVQNPYKMGQLVVRTLVDHLEKKKVEPKVSTGETLATLENMDTPEVAALLSPPKEPAAGPGVTASGGKKRWRVMVIPKGTTHEFWQSIHAGAEKGARDIGGVEMIWQGPERESERNKQIELLQNAIAQKVDGVGLAPLDAAALVPYVEQAIERGIAVVIFDSGLGETKSSAKPISYIATDNYHGGVLAAERLGALLKGEGKIILLRYMVGSASTEEREKGFTDTIKAKFPKIVYLSDNQYAGATADTAQRESENLVTKYRGQVDGIFCPNESSTFGMLRALESAGMVRGR